MEAEGAAVTGPRPTAKGGDAGRKGSDLPDEPRTSVCGISLAFVVVAQLAPSQSGRARGCCSATRGNRHRTQAREGAGRHNWAINARIWRGGLVPANGVASPADARRSACAWNHTAPGRRQPRAVCMWCMSATKKGWWLLAGVRTWRRDLTSLCSFSRDR